MSETALSVIITRPEPYATQLAKALTEHDFKIDTCPLIEFIGNSELDKHLTNIDFVASDYLLFVSQQAAHFFLQALNQEQIDLLTGKILIAVGQSTQLTIKEYGLEALIPDRFDSEGILELIAQLNTANNNLNILLICGNDGRKLLEEELGKQHQIERLEVYQRIGLAQSFPNITQPNRTAIIVTSEQLLELSLHQLALQQTPQMQTSDKSLLQSVAFICASSRIVEKAKALGVANPILADGASNDDLVKACLEWHNENTALNHNPKEQSDTMSESDQHDNEIIEALELDQELDQEPDNSASDKPRKKGGILNPLFLLLLLAAIGYGAYWLWNQGYFLASDSKNTNDANPELSRIVNLEKQMQQQASTIDSLITSNSKLDVQNTNMQQELSRQVESLQQQLVASQRKFQSFSADAATQARDWQIAEAEYLVRQAAQKIHYSDDTASIVALLEAADQQILASGDTNLLGLRRAISQDIAQIKSHVAIDIDGILVKLDAIQSQLKNLTLSSVKFDSEEAPTVTEEVVEDSAWQTFKSNIKNTFSGYYKIHHYDQAVKPFINPQQADLLQQNILLSIKAAQLSTLRHQQKGYNKSITELKNWISEYYQSDNASKAILEQLELLATAQVSVQLPGKLQSLNFIKLNNQERLNQWLQSPTLEGSSQENKLDTEEEDELGQSGNIDATIQNALERMQSDNSEKSNEDGTEQDGEQL